MQDVQNLNLSKIIKRLELIKSLISLEEEGTAAKGDFIMKKQMQLVA